MSNERKKKMKKACLITTDKRGVFMGYIDTKDRLESSIEATEIRMCVYWSADVRGVIGLAATGPTSGCKITKAADRGILHGVTAVLELTEEAEANWKKEPWS